MPQLQMCVSILRLIADSSSVSHFRFGPAAGFLECMAVLDPNWRISGVAIESHAVEPGRELPLPRLAGAVGAGNDRGFAVLAIEKRH